MLSFHFFFANQHDVWANFRTQQNNSGKNIYNNIQFTTQTATTATNPGEDKNFNTSVSTKENQVLQQQTPTTIFFFLFPLIMLFRKRNRKINQGCVSSVSIFSATADSNLSLFTFIFFFFLSSAVSLSLFLLCVFFFVCEEEQKISSSPFSVSYQKTMLNFFEGIHVCIRFFLSCVSFLPSILPVCVCISFLIKNKWWSTQQKWIG